MWLFHPIFVFVLSPYVAYERPILHVQGTLKMPRRFKGIETRLLGVLFGAFGANFLAFMCSMLCTLLECIQVH